MRTGRVSVLITVRVYRWAPTVVLPLNYTSVDSVADLEGTFYEPIVTQGLEGFSCLEQQRPLLADCVPASPSAEPNPQRH